MSIEANRPPRTVPGPCAARAVRQPAASVLAHAMAALTGPDLWLAPSDISSDASLGFQSWRTTLTKHGGRGNAGAAARAATALVANPRGAFEWSGSTGERQAGCGTARVVRPRQQTPFLLLLILLLLLIRHCASFVMIS